MPAKTTGDTPADVTLNLDTLEREGADPEPFVFVLGGDRFVCADVQNEDWQTVAALDEDDPQEALKLLLGRDYEKFAKHRLPLWKLNALLEKWRDHTGGVTVGEAGASPTS
jgi:hypothetical protein